MHGRFSFKFRFNSTPSKAGLAGSISAGVLNVDLAEGRKLTSDPTYELAFLWQRRAFAMLCGKEGIASWLKAAACAVFCLAKAEAHDVRDWRGTQREREY